MGASKIPEELVEGHPLYKKINDWSGHVTRAEKYAAEPNNYVGSSGVDMVKSARSLLSKIYKMRGKHYDMKLAWDVIPAGSPEDAKAQSEIEAYEREIVGQLWMLEKLLLRFCGGEGITIGQLKV